MEKIIVIGGGIIGLSIALRLASEGTRVTILEKDTCGGQASGAAAGMLAPFSEIGEDQDVFFDFSLASLTLYPEWQAYVRKTSGVDFEYSKSGSLHCVYHEADLLPLYTRSSWQKDYNKDMQILNQEEVLALEPHLSEEIKGAIYYPNEAHIYAPDFVKALIEACKRSSVDICEHLGEVEILSSSSDDVQVKARGQVFEADQVVVTTGAWAQKQAETLGLNLPIYPIRGQICAYRPNESLLNHIVYTSQGYLVPKANGTIVNGASEDIAGFETSVTAKGMDRLKRWNKKILPALQDEPTIHEWAGLRPATQDGFPYIGRLTDHPKIYFACGHYRNGILLSAITAKVVTEDLLERDVSFPLEAFHPERFS
ncbi:glycine oxidase ThiO [Shouchella sp. JSM 1781072]|uniref:glycine oxidase ThiO n=1 Tax=Bacillaceae TaxID=186817 RepID=UPI000C070BD4|nr:MULTISPECIES: glycine oxidase ThiO [Bacillaceae]UTR07996.1 glycine oxidase ThiO [Alkalihalobacillus sp. LMS6]